MNFHTDVLKISLPLIFLFGCELLHANPYSDCAQLASELNKNTPIIMDKSTTTKSVSCIEKNSHLALVFVHEIALAKRYINIDGLQSMKPTVLKMWCTQYKRREFIDYVDVIMDYFDGKGVFLTEIKLTGLDCKQFD